MKNTFFFNKIAYNMIFFVFCKKKCFFDVFLLVRQIHATQAKVSSAAGNIIPVALSTKHSGGLRPEVISQPVHEIFGLLQDLYFRLGPGIGLMVSGCIWEWPRSKLEWNCRGRFSAF